MATITVTNISSGEVYLSDLYTKLAASASVSTDRAVSDLSKMKGLQSLVAAGSCTVSIAYTADEKNSGMVDEGEGAVGATGTTMSTCQIIRLPIAAGGGGSADDVTVYALGALPFKKMRIVDVVAYVSAGASGGRTMQVRSAAAGAGTLCGEVGAAANGRQAQTVTVTATQVLTNGGTVGLFVRRSDSAIAGEIEITVRQEV